MKPRLLSAHQRTVKQRVTRSGVGLHCGQAIRLTILPAPEDHGITFVREDLPKHAEIRACAEHVVDTRLATTLGAGVNGSRATVATVEHLLAAFAGCGIDNARVFVDGPEIPIFDGSAAPFVEMVEAAEIEEQRRPKKVVVMRREVSVSEGESRAKISPANHFEITCGLDFDHPLVSQTPYRFEFSHQDFVRYIARARTFGFLKDVEALQSQGLALGGSLDNAVVIDHYRVLNPDGLRYSDEFVRHKLLDAIGDLFLLGMPLVGKVRMHRSGHALNTALVKKVLADPRNYEVVHAVPAAAEETEQRARPAFYAAESSAF